MRKLVAVVGFTIVVLFSTTASALTINGTTNVGVLDDLLGGVNLDSSEQAEKEYLAAQLGEDAEDLSLQKIDGNSAFKLVDGSSTQYAIDFGAAGIIDPVLFLIRVGNGVYSHYLYDNLNSLQYGVIDLGEIQARKGNITISSVSHVSTVPEPGTILLLGLGVAACCAGRRRRIGAP